MAEVSTNTFYKQAFKGNAFFGISNFISKFFVFINIVIILKYLSVYEYGVYKLAFSLFALAGAFLLRGLDGIVLNEASAYLGSKSRPSVKRLLFEYSILKILLSILTWGILFFSANIVADHYNAWIGSYLRIISFLYLSESFITILTVLFKATLNFFIAAFIPLVTEIIKLIALLYFIFIHESKLGVIQVLYSAVIASYFTAIIVFLYFMIIYRSKLALPKQDRFILLRTIRGYGKWAIAKSYISNFPANARLWLIKIFISTEAVAIFCFAESLFAQAKKIIPRQAFTSIVPRYINDLKHLARIYRSSVKYFLVLFVSVGFVSYLLVPIGVKIFFPKYIISIPYFQAMLIILVVHALTLTGVIVYSLRKQKFLFFQPIIEIVLTLALSLIFIPTLGIWGVVIAYILTRILAILILYFYLARYNKMFKIRIKDIFSYKTSDKELIKELYSCSKSYIRTKFNLFKNRVYKK